MLKFREKRANGRILATARANGEERVEQYRERAVDALHTGADAARGMAKRASKAVRRTGDRLDDAAEYIEHYDVSRAPRDMGRWLRSHPVSILAAATVAGFFVVRSLTRPH